MKNVAIIGAGSHGRGIREILNQYSSAYVSFYGFLDDDKDKKGVVAPINAKLPDNVHYVLGINNSATRSKVAPLIHPDNTLATAIIHPSATVGSGCDLGDGVVIQAGVILTTDVKLGQNTHVNVGTTISQGTVIGKQTTISPGVHIAGEVQIGKRVQIGTGSSIINLVKICDDVIIGAGGVVVKDITEPGTYIGVPARRIK